MSASANLALPFIEGGELLPDVTLNETLRLIDTLVQLAIVDRDLNTPPGSPSEGQRWIVKASPSPTGAWAGHGNHIAAWQDGAWVFCTPRNGWLAYVLDEGALIAWNGTAWVDAGAMLTTFQNVALLGVGTTADATNPFSAKLNNALWVAKTVAEGGDGHLRYKTSKESAAKTLSLLFQDNFSGRAEIGLTGDDDFHFKVSADGSSWLDAITIDKSTGKLAANQGFSSPATTRGQLYAAPFDALAFNGMQSNGSMEVSQENGATLITAPAGYIVDKWQVAKGGSQVINAQQVSDAPAGYQNSLKITVTTANGSPGSSDFVIIAHVIEGYRAARLGFGAATAQSLSFGFWVKAHQTGAYSGSVRNSGNSRSYPFSFTVSAADVWEFKTVTLSGDTAGTWLTTTGLGLSVTFSIMAGSSLVGTANAWTGSNLIGVTGTTNGVAATSDTFQITGFIVLPGIELPSSSRAPFIMRPFDQELLLCRRYWWSSFAYGTMPAQNAGTGTGELISTCTAASTGVRFPLLFSPMRVAPTVTLYNPGAANAQARDQSGSLDGSSFGTDYILTDHASISGFAHASSSAGNRYGVHAKFDARL